MRVADYVFDILSNYNISDCFSVTGRGSLFLTDALILEEVAPISFNSECPEIELTRYWL